MVRIIGSLLYLLYSILNFIIVLRNLPTKVQQRNKNFEKSQRILSKLRYIILLVTILLEIYIKDYTEALKYSVLLLVTAMYDVSRTYWR